MQKGKQSRNRGNAEFFWLGLSHETLINYYRVNFSMMQHHQYSLTELENMLPWEREVYITLLLEWIAEENERIQEQKRKM